MRMRYNVEMSFSRLFLPLLFAFALLFAQQGGITHAMSHALAGHSQPENNQPENNPAENNPPENNPKDKQAPHSQVCGQCASYAQLGGAINSTLPPYAILTKSTASILQLTVAFYSIPVLAAFARGPPAFQRLT